MNTRTGRLLAILVGLVVGGVSYLAYPDPLLAGYTGVFWLVAGLLARRNAPLTRQSGNRWSAAQGGLSSLAAFGAFWLATSLSLSAGFGFALALFVLGVSYAMTGLGVEMANAHAGADGGDTVPGASAVRDGDDGANAAAGR